MTDVDHSDLIRCASWQDVPANRCVWRLNHGSDHRYVRAPAPAERQYGLIQCRHVSGGHAGALCSRCSNKVRSALARMLEAIERQGDNVNPAWLADQIKELADA